MEAVERMETGIVEAGAMDSSVTGSSAIEENSEGETVVVEDPTCSHDQHQEAEHVRVTEGDVSQDLASELTLANVDSAQSALDILQPDAGELCSLSVEDLSEIRPTPDVHKDEISPAGHLNELEDTENFNAVSCDASVRPLLGEFQHSGHVSSGVEVVSRAMEVTGATQPIRGHNQDTTVGGQIDIGFRDESLMNDSIATVEQHLRTRPLEQVCAGDQIEDNALEGSSAQLVEEDCAGEIVGAHVISCQHGGETPPVEGGEINEKGGLVLGGEESLADADHEEDDDRIIESARPAPANGGRIGLGGFVRSLFR